MKKLLLILGLGFMATALWAQCDPGRSQTPANFIAPIDASGDDADQFQPESTPITQTASAIAEAITPDIQALAGNLDNDPTQIFNYVHDQIRYVHYFGSKKGAELTLLERSGNDFDQCALLSALLQAAGYSPGYQFGIMKMPYDGTNNQDLHHWLGLSMLNTNWSNTQNYFGYFFGTRGNWFWATFGDTNTIGFQRVWVTLNLDGTNYYLDPSFKVSQPVSGVNLASAMGLSTNTLWTSAGGTDAGTSVSGLNETALRGALQTCNGNLLSYLSNNIPDATVAQVIGGQQIVSSSGLPLPTSLAFPLYTSGAYPLLNWTNQPTNFMGTFSISFDGTNQTWYTPQLEGGRLSLTFSNNGVAQLWLDDSQILQVNNTSPSNTVNVILSATHPYGAWNTNENIPIDAGVSAGFDRSSTNAYQTTNASYAIMYAFEANPAWLTERQQKLAAYLAAGYTNGSRQVTTETLNVMGLNWMVQTELAQELLCQQWGQLPEHQHRFGRMAQEASRGYYVDVYLQLDGAFPGTSYNASDILANNEVFDVSSYIWSAMEHGVIEQLQDSNLVAASTVKMIEIASTNSQTVYLANSGNWSGVEGALSGYSSSTLSTLAGLTSRGYVLLLPQNGSNTVAGTGTWAGYGYVELGSTAVGRSMGMIINGAYNGGYVSNPDATINTPVVTQAAYSQPTFFTPQSATAPLSGQTGADPVNLVDGSFEITTTDLTLGQQEPRGLNFTRYYSSARRNSNLAGIAPGWLHSYYCNVVPTSDPEGGLGTATVQQMVQMIVATCAALNLYNDTTPDAKNWTMTALIAKWGIDQLINNAVSVNLGKDTLQFLKQPNGLFTPPGNCTLSLVQTNSAYQLQERHGRTFKFGTNDLLTNIVDQYGQSMTFSYNASNLVTNVTDWVNRSLTFTYTDGALTSVADSTGRSVSYGYTGADLTSYTDPEQKTTSYAYDTNNELVATFDALSRLVESNYYDGFGHITTQLTQGATNKTWQIHASGYYTMVIDPAGDEQIYTYDAKSRLIASQDGMGNITQTAYDGQDHIVQTISPLGETNQLMYDGNNNLVETIDPLGYSNVFTFNANNELIAFTDARGHASHFGYNGQFSLIGQTNGNGDWTVFSFNSNGTLASRQDSGGTTTCSYDGYGQLSGITNPGSLGIESFVNSALGDPTTYTDARGFATTFAYNNRRQCTNTTVLVGFFYQSLLNSSFDAVGNLSTVTDARGLTSSNSWSVTRHLLSTTLPPTPQGTPVLVNGYDARDWLASSQDPLGNTTYYTNDAAQRLIASTDPLNRSTLFGYDNDSHETNVTDAASDQLTRFWDVRGNLVRVIDAATNIVGKKYDGANNLIFLTNRNGKVWQFQYDGANRLTNTISPLSHSSSQLYNNRGLLQSTTDPLSQTTSFGYDARARMTNKTDNLGSINYQYDGNNNLTGLTNVASGAKLSWVYDVYNWPTRFTDAAGNIIFYAYDANHNVTNLIYPGGRIVKYYYDSLNRVTNVTDWTGRKTLYAYDLAGHVTSVTRPNNTVRLMSYDNDGELTNIVERTTSQYPIAFYTLNYNLAGRVQWEFKGPLPHAYTPPSRTMTFDNDNRLATFNGTSVTVDADGNLTYGPGTDNTFGTYAYDARNRLTSAGGVSYGYDPANNRTSSSTDGTIYVNDSKTSQLLMRSKITAGTYIVPSTGYSEGVTYFTTNYYIYGIGLLYEIDETLTTDGDYVDGGILCPCEVYSTTTNLVFYHYDGRGSTVALTDTNGNITDQMEYSPYGTTTYRAGTTDTPFLYNGQFGVQTDANGLLYMRARYYNPYISRFINADPSGFSGGLNFYAFCNDNPINVEDPFGLQVPGLVETAIGFGPGYGQSVAQYDSQVQSVSQQAMAIEGVIGSGAVLGAGLSAGVGFGAAALVSAGVSQNVVTGGLLVAGGAGLYTTGVSVYNNPSVYNIAFNGGTLGGGSIAGDLMGFSVASALSPPGFQPTSEGSLGSELSMAWTGPNGLPNPLAFLSAWLLPGAEVPPMTTGPSPVSAGVTMAGTGSGLAAAAQMTIGNSATGK